MAKTIVGLFDNYEDAQGAVNALVDAGISHNDISIVASNAHDNFITSDGGQVVHRGVTGGIVKGAAEGAVLGGLTGFAASVALFLIPGIGPVVGAGALAATLGGAGLGAVGGGAIGGLSRLGIPQEEAGYYAEGIRRGGTLVTVRAEDDMADQAVSIIDGFNPVNVDERAAYYKSTGYTGYSETAPAYTPDQITAERATYTSNYATAPVTTAPVTTAPVTTAPVTTAPVTTAPVTTAPVTTAPVTTAPVTTAPVTTAPVTTAPVTTAAATIATPSTSTVNVGETVAIPIVEETLQVGKREVQRGGARVHTHVIETPVEEQVTLREEHVTVERNPVNRAVSGADLTNAFQDSTIELTERAEEAVIGKQARVVEEVVIGKEATERTETVRDTVRRTDVEVEELTATGTSTTTTARSNY